MPTCRNAGGVHGQKKVGKPCNRVQGVSQLLKQSDWAQIQDFK